MLGDAANVRALAKQCQRLGHDREGILVQLLDRVLAAVEGGDDLVVVHGVIALDADAAALLLGTTRAYVDTLLQSGALSYEPGPVGPEILLTAILEKRRQLDAIAEISHIGYLEEVPHEATSA